MILLKYGGKGTRIKKRWEAQAINYFKIINVRENRHLVFFCSTLWCTEATDQLDNGIYA